MLKSRNIFVRIYKCGLICIREKNHYAMLVLTFFIFFGVINPNPPTYHPPPRALSSPNPLLIFPRLVSINFLFRNNSL